MNEAFKTLRSSGQCQCKTGALRALATGYLFRRQNRQGSQAMIQFLELSVADTKFY